MARATWVLLALLVVGVSGVSLAQLPVRIQSGAIVPLLGPGTTLPGAAVGIRPGASTTAATESTFSTRLTGTSFEWTFGAGARPPSATTAGQTSPTVVLGEPGNYTVRVLARSGSGATEASAAYTVTPFRPTVTSLGAFRARGAWNTYSLVRPPSAEPVLVHCDDVMTKQVLKLARRSADGWTRLDVTDSANGCAGPVAVVASDGRMRIVVGRLGTTRSIDYLVARVAVPTALTDWTRSRIADDWGDGGPIFLEMRSDGRPVVAYMGTDQRAHVAVARVASPAAASDWTVSIASQPIGDFGFALVGDRPALLFRTDDPPSPDNGVRLAVATSSEPRATADYTLTTLPRPAGNESAFGGYDPALAVVDGRLVAAFRELGTLRFARTTTGPTDFAITTVRDHVGVGFAESVGARISLFQGRPMITWANDQEKVAIAFTRTPAGPADWHVFDARPTVEPGFATLPIAIDGGGTALLTAQYGGLSELRMVDFR